MSVPLKVTAFLATPIAFQESIKLDGLLEYRSCHLNKIGGGLLTRADPAPQYGEIPIPIVRQRIGGVLVPVCSDPIFAAGHRWHEHVASRFPSEYARLMDAGNLTKINTTGGQYKSIRLPLDCRMVERIVWFTRGHRKPLLKMLKGVDSLGKKRSNGYGRVGEWAIEKIEEDYSWYAPRGDNLVLMRPLPACDELPGNLAGYRPDFGAVQSPYWHPDRFTERVVPV